METSFFQWIVEWVWVPVFVAWGEAFRRLFNIESDLRALEEREAQRERMERMSTTAVRNIESGVHNLGERLANIEGYLDGKK